MSVADITITRDGSGCHHRYNLGQMGRWEPDARGRIARAAMDLYAKRGFDRTTVAEIADRAGVTERTFFRHFADKREVLFGGSGRLEQLVASAVVGAPDSASPIDAVGTGLLASATMLSDQDYSRKRQAIITSHADLRERELIKMESLASAIAEALQRRGVRDPAASLAAETGVAAFRIAFERWVEKNNKKDLPQLIRESLAQLQALFNR